MNKLLKKLRWIYLILAVFIIDLVTKILIVQNFNLGEILPLFPFINLCYVCNYGIAFSFFSDRKIWQFWLFSGIAAAVCITLTILMYRSKITKNLNNIAYALIIGGTLGNLLDRLWHGFVIDMIEFYIGDWHFAIFNFADMAICIGIALIILEGFF